MILNLLFLLIFSYQELKLPDMPKQFITDDADLLSAQTEQLLNDELYEYENQTSNQFLVYTTNSIGENSLEDFSIKLAEKWKPGQKNSDNGLILIIIKDISKIRIEVGYGLEGVIPDLIAAQVIREKIAPYFKEGDFESGIINGLKFLKNASQGEYKGLKKKKNQDYSVEINPLLIIALLFGGLGIDILRYKNRDPNDKVRYPTFFPWFFSFGLLIIILKMLAQSRGGGGFSGSGNHRGGGGYSSGGGRFGGGGASGGW